MLNDNVMCVFSWVLLTEKISFSHIIFTFYYPFYNYFYVISCMNITFYFFNIRFFKQTPSMVHHFLKTLYESENTFIYKSVGSNLHFMRKKICYCNYNINGSFLTICRFSYCLPWVLWTIMSHTCRQSYIINYSRLLPLL